MALTRKSLIIATLALFLGTWQVESSAQIAVDSLTMGQTIEVEMHNGEEFRGVYQGLSGRALVLVTTNGEIRLIMQNVKQISEYDPNSLYVFQNPNETRYFFAPSAIPLRKGEGYYQNTMLSLNFVNVGVTDNVSIGGGLELISTFAGSPIWFLTPKVGFKVDDKSHVGAGALVAGLAGEGAFTLTYGVYTYGSSDSNITLGIGYGWSDGEGFPTFTLSGMHRVSNSVSLMSENYLLSDGSQDLFFSIQGLRFLTRRSSFDVGLIVSPELFEDVGIPTFPYVGYVRYF